ncbi:MAG: hypothetical protein IJ320_07520 [Phascolarctobacterium sp.]|nr:hypothetical protein [Phascolarctobacterium sp.]
MNSYIPKKIHYVWVGDKEKPALVESCIQSWRKYCPDYEIIEWGNDILKTINNTYVQEAYENKKYAFVSDYLRLYVLYKYGGFYFDTDLEITNNIDKFREYDALVLGYEIWNGEVSPLTALIGSTKGNNVIREILNLYDNITFIKNGDLDETTNVVRIAKFLEERYGFKQPYDGTKFTKLKEDIVIFPYYFFVHQKTEKRIILFIILMGHGLSLIPESVNLQ